MIICAAVAIDIVIIIGAMVILKIHIIYLDLRKPILTISDISFECFLLYHCFPRVVHSNETQDLTITLVSERDVSEVQLVEDTEEKCGINAKAFSSEQEWKLFREVNVWNKTVVKKANKMTKKHSGFNTAAKASRRPQFFIWNILVIMVSGRASMPFIAKQKVWVKLSLRGLQW